jgi:hypothetical protein
VSLLQARQSKNNYELRGRFKCSAAKKVMSSKQKEEGDHFLVSCNASNEANVPNLVSASCRLSSVIVITSLIVDFRL